MQNAWELNDDEDKGGGLGDEGGSGWHLGNGWGQHRSQVEVGKNTLSAGKLGDQLPQEE
jgi:hypothetical protein